MFVNFAEHDFITLTFRYNKFNSKIVASEVI
jgi:hypothetical protein